MGVGVSSALVVVVLLHPCMRAGVVADAWLRIRKTSTRLSSIVFGTGTPSRERGAYRLCVGQRSLFYRPRDVLWSGVARWLDELGAR